MKHLMVKICLKIKMEKKISLKTNNDHILLNYFPNDQSKHIDYVIQYDDESLDLPLDRKTRRNKNLIRRKQLRNKFLLQLITQEKFEVYKIIKRIEIKKSFIVRLKESPKRLKE